MTGPICYQRSPQVRFRVVDGEGVALLQEVGEIILVNATGALILELLQERQSVLELVRAMEARVDSTREVLLQEIPPFLNDLENVGAIERTPA